MPVSRIDQQITFLYTRDLVATARFYEQLLGLELALDQVDCRVYRIVADCYLGFCQRASAPEEPAGILYTFVTEDVDGWYETLASCGVPFDAPPRLNPTYGIYHCFCVDPNGYKIEIQRFCDANWDQVSAR